MTDGIVCAALFETPFLSMKLTLALQTDARALKSVY